MTASPGRRLLSVDALRGGAALAVLAYHLLSPYVLDLRPAHPALYGLCFPLLLGYSGVHLFLVISGFCIHLRFARGQNPDAPLQFAAFWKRRIRRLYPSYLAAVAVSVLLFRIAAGLWLGSRAHGLPLGYASRAAFAGDLFAHLCMLQLFWGATLFGLHNGPLWSLALEEQLYLLYTPYRALRKRLGPFGPVGVALGIALVWRTAAIFNPWRPGVPIMPPLPVHAPWIVAPDRMVWLAQAPARWFEWCLGALAVEAYFDLVRLPAWCFDLRVGAACLAAAAAALFHPLGWVVNDLLFGMAYFVLINAAGLREGDLRASGAIGGLAWVGLGSYSVYLIHAPVMSFTAFWINREGWRLPLVIFTACQAAAALSAAALFFWIVERHFIRRPGTE